MKKLYDNMKINDDIFGHFIIKDDYGNIVISKHNTITDKGREFIFSTFIRALNIASGDITDYSNYNFSEFKFYIDNQMTIPTMDISSLSNNVYSHSLTSTNVSINKNENNDLFIQFTISILPSTTNESNSGLHFNSIGLIISNGTTNTLFSRVVVDDVYINPASKYTLQYNIYF